MVQSLRVDPLQKLGSPEFKQALRERGDWEGGSGGLARQFLKLAAQNREEVLLYAFATPRRIFSL